jgi:hypothetical protein
MQKAGEDVDAEGRGSSVDGRAKKHLPSFAGLDEVTVRILSSKGR